MGFFDLFKSADHRRIDQLEAQNKMMRESIAHNQKEAKRWFAAVTNVTGGVPTIRPFTDINKQLLAQLNVLKMTARNMSGNNPNFRRWVRESVKGIVGAHGFQLQNDSDNDGFNDKIEAMWADFCKAENFDISGKLSFKRMSDLAVKSYKIDGEAFIRIVRGVGKYNIKFQLLDSIAVNALLNKGKDSDGNQIINGVKVDEQGRPISYYLTYRGYWYPDTASGVSTDAQDTEVPASDIIHLFEPWFAGQVRGFPDSVASMISIDNILRYTQDEMLAARICANKFMYLTNSGMQVDSISPMSPEKVEILPSDSELKQLNPTHPTANYPEFVKAQKLDAAAGLGVSYATMSGDLREANYSSNRVGMISERDGWENDQQNFIECVCNKMFEAFKVEIFATGKLTTPEAKFLSPTFIPRAFDWIDPEKDMKADQLEASMFLNDPITMSRKRGKEFNRTLKNWTRVFTELKSIGISPEQYLATFAPQNLTLNNQNTQAEGEDVNPKA